MKRLGHAVFLSIVLMLCVNIAVADDSVPYTTLPMTTVLQSSRVGPHGTDPLTPRYVRCRIPRF